MNSLLKNCYFLLDIISPNITAGQNTIFFTQSLEELKQHIQYKYEAADAEAVCAMSIEKLLQGYSYDLSYTQGTRTQEAYIKLFDYTNIRELCEILNSADMESDEDEPIYLGDELLHAKTIEQIQEIIELYNEIMFEW